MASLFYRTIPSLLIIYITVCSFTTVEGQSISVDVLSYNIRFANPDDAPNTWEKRKEDVFNLIREAKPDIFGLQEVLNEQVVDFEFAFKGFKRAGVGRDDGNQLGEYSPIFYNSTKFNLIKGSTFWLSETLSVAGSRGWDAACNRVVTWIQLTEKSSGLSFFVFCTHFDHVGEIARRNSAKLLLHALDSLAANKPSIVLGDFNATPDSEPYLILTDFSNPKKITDAYTIGENIKGPDYTYTGFKVGGLPPNRIDYVFVKNTEKIVFYNVNQTNNGTYYPSDHLPVNVRLKIN
ncbi:MAG: endonuclease/exonuclease/phosphatase family protein [Bacteroidales bacterium]